MKKVLLTLLVAGSLVGGATSSFAAATAKPSVKPMTGTTTAKPMKTAKTTAKPMKTAKTTAKPMATATTKATK